MPKILVFVEPSDPFTSDDPFKSDPFAQFKTVSFADSFSSDPFEVFLCWSQELHVSDYLNWSCLDVASSKST